MRAGTYGRSDHRNGTAAGLRGRQQFRGHRGNRNPSRARDRRDITELAERLAGIMVYLGGKAATPEAGHAMAAEALASGKGLAQFRKFVQAQGGDPAVVDECTRAVPQAAHHLELLKLKRMAMCRKSQPERSGLRRSIPARAEQRGGSQDRPGGRRLSAKTRRCRQAGRRPP